MSGGYRDDRRGLSGKLFQRYEQELRIRHYSPRTISTYDAMLRKYVAWLGPVHPRDADAETIRAYLLSRVEARLSRSYIDQSVSALKFLYVELYGWEDDAFDVARPRRERKLPFVPTREQIIAMADGTANRKHRAAILLLYASGLRLSELVRLQVRDLDLEALTVHVRAGKGTKDRLTLLSERLVPELRWLADGRGPVTPVFTGAGDRRWSSRSVQHVVAQAGKRAQLPQAVHPHCLRHAFATHLLEAGVDLLIVRNLLGHRNTSTTARYIHMRDPGKMRIKSPL